MDLKDMSTITLKELRQRRGMTQDATAAIMEVQQSFITKIEKRENLTFDLVKRYIEALGGNVTLVATFPEESFIIPSLGRPS
jgi:transcriptional regulator with XRE-family HTH domain